MRRPTMRAGLGACLLLAAAAAALPGCGTPGQDLQVDVPTAPVLPASYPVGEEIGRLLSSDAEASRAAEARLIALDGERRERLLTYAATLPRERDLRWLHVLDEHHALPALTPNERLDFLLWKAARPERSLAMKARSQLMDMARSDPAPLIEHLRAGEAGSDELSVVLGVTRTRAAFPVLLERYRAAYGPAQRTAPAEALALIVGDGRKPRVYGSPAELAREADVLESWYREQLEIEADRAAGPPEGGPR